MNKEQMRIAIARAVGWKEETDGEPSPGIWWHPDGFYPRLTENLPDFCESLDAMHSAELATFTTGDQWTAYYDALDEICDGENDSRSAKAEQRATAFCKTLNLEIK